MIQFEWEWQLAPGSSDPVMDATWARWRLRLGEHLVTDVLDLRAGSRRDATYSSLWPVVVWMLENWWFLQHEAMHEDATRDPGWVSRHCLGRAVRSAALPHLTTYRGSPDLIVQWRSTNRQREPLAPIHYLSDGRRRSTGREWHDACARLIEAVFGRLADRGIHAQEADDYAARWAQIRGASPDDVRRCTALARLGLDPYDPDEAEDSVVELLDGPVASWPEPLAGDFLDGAEPEFLAETVSWVDSICPMFRTEGRQVGAVGVPAAGAARPATSGYGLARAARQQGQMAPEEAIGDLLEWLSERMGLHDFVVHHPGLSHPSRISGLVGVQKATGRPGFVPDGIARQESRMRFLIGRALYVAQAGHTAPRLLSDARLPLQQASRAFAAELLAPARGLAELLGPRPTHAAFEQAAQHYGVERAVVRHQWDNQVQQLVA